MPTLTSISIPVIERASREPSLPKGKAPVRTSVKPRYYSEEPLPIQISQHAPLHARIVSRNINYQGLAKYDLTIGPTTIEDVGLEEVLDYVSAYELEQFENKQFEEEREVLRVLEKEKAEEERLERERRRERAKMRGVAQLQDVEMGEEALGQRPEPPAGRRGRARPSYSHMFIKAQEKRRRRKRDPFTNELLQLSDNEGPRAAPSLGAEQRALSSSVQAEGLPPRRRRKRDKVTGILMPLSDREGEDPSVLAVESSAESSAEPSAKPSAEVQPRRRRKRDTITGELLPLGAEPEAAGELKKRPRRKRHPETGELMPLGWRPDAETKATATARGPRSEQSMPPLKRLSISGEHQAKRPRLEVSSSTPRSASPAILIPSPSKHVLVAPGMSKRVTAVIEISSSSASGSTTRSRRSSFRRAVEPAPRSKPIRRSTGGATILRNRQPSVSEASSESSSEDEAIVAKPAPSKQTLLLSPTRAMTTITKPSTLKPTAAATRDAMEMSSDEDGDDDDSLADDEWYVDKILAHHLSDPRTHPAQYGKQAIMLYQVKWQGFPEPTWEPPSSFSDLTTLRQYQQKVGLPLVEDDD